MCIITERGCALSVGRNASYLMHDLIIRSTQLDNRAPELSRVVSRRKNQGETFRVFIYFSGKLSPTAREREREIATVASPVRPFSCSKKRARGGIGVRARARDLHRLEVKSQMRWHPLLRSEGRSGERAEEFVRVVGVNDASLSVAFSRSFSRGSHSRPHRRSCNGDE